LPSRLAQATKEREQLQKELRSAHEIAQPTTKSGGEAGSAPGQTRAAEVARTKAMFADPRWRDLNLKANVVSLDRHYQPLFARLGLSPEEIQRMETILNSRLSESVAAGPVSSSTIGAQDEISRRAEADIASFLGPSRYAEYQNYNRSGPARDLAAKLAASVYFTAAPLTPEQGNQLTSLIASTSAEFVAGGQVRMNTVNWDAVVSGAQGIMGPDQLAALQSLRIQQQTEQMIDQKASALRTLK
jgi:hypothetical protein